MQKENGIDTIYTYDFNLDDNENGNTFIRMSDGSENAGVNYNYMYGEVVKQYLTNIDDWIEFPSTTERAISYTNAKGETETVGRIQQPIAFIYNKDNTTNYSDKEDNADKYPVMYAFEQMVERDKDGLYTKEYDEEGNEVTDKNGDPVKHYCTKKYNAQMKKMFDFINDNNIEFTEYSKEDFVRENYPALKDAEKVNIKTVTYRQFAWLLQQDGNAIYMVGGPYDEATQNEIADVNAKAVKNDVNVYLWDPYVDGKISEDDWGYKNTGDIMKSDSINFMYTTLIENSLTNLTTEEFEIMKKHTVIGEDILKKLDTYQDEKLVQVAMQICRSHHERYDGQGYPKGLIGDEIPLEAQVVGLADAYDALISERPYKRKINHGEAVRMIVNGECGSFSPKVILSFIIACMNKTWIEKVSK